MVDDSPTVDVSVVIPVYREGDHLEEVVEAALSALAPLKESWEIVLVDDGSDDRTWEVILSLAGRTPAVRGLRLSRNFGKEAATCAGIETARGGAVIVMDGDLQHPPSLIPRMVSLWRETGADIVEGVKSDRGQEGAVSAAIRKGFYQVMGRLSGFDLAGASDFKLLGPRALEAYRRMGERALFFRGMVAWLGFRRVQVPFEVGPRVGGRSRWPLAGLLRLAITGFTSFSAAALRVVNLAGLVFFVFAIILGARALWVYFTGASGAGITTVVFLQLITGSLLLFGLGIIGEYIARIHDEVKGRPRYLISDRTEDRPS